jgi:hypothetical protein
MRFHNIIAAIAVTATIVVARPQDSDLVRRSYSLNGRQDIQGPAACDDFGNNQYCPGQPSLCCFEGSLCLLDISPAGQATFQCF